MYQPIAIISLESLRIAAYSTTESKFLAGQRVFDVQRALDPLQGLCTGPHGTLRQLRLGDAGDALEVIVARVAEVRCSEAEVDGYRAAVATLVLQEVSAVFGTHLQATGGGMNAGWVNAEWRNEQMNVEWRNE